MLEERAAGLGAAPRRGHDVLTVRQDADAAEAEVRGPDGAVREIRSAYVVGCDGGRSVVRTAAGIDFPGTDETLTGMLGDFEVIGPDGPALAAEHGVLAVPMAGGLTRIVLIDPERMRVPSAEPVTPDELRAALVRACGSDLGVARPRWLSRFGNATRLAARYRQGRLLLAGDAAHIHFPAAGQGLNTGLQDAANLGWKLAAEVNGWAPPGLLDTYHDERHPVGAAVTANTEVQTLLWELTLVSQYRRPGAALRDLIGGLLELAPVNRRIAGQVAGLDTVYPPSAPDADPLTGHRMPDVPLAAPGSAATRVHELLRDGRFVLLDLTGDRESFGDRDTCGDRAPDGPGPVRGGWARRVTALAAATRRAHPLLADVTEVLVRPDGHVAWATRTTAPDRRRAERVRALTAWAGRPDAGR